MSRQRRRGTVDHKVDKWLKWLSDVMSHGECVGTAIFYTVQIQCNGQQWLHFSPLPVSGSDSPSNTIFLGSPAVCTPDLSRFCRTYARDRQTNRQTHYATRSSIAIDRISCIQCIQKKPGYSVRKPTQVVSCLLLLGLCCPAMAAVPCCWSAKTAVLTRDSVAWLACINQTQLISVVKGLSKYVELTAVRVTVSSSYRRTERPRPRERSWKRCRTIPILSAGSTLTTTGWTSGNQLVPCQLVPRPGSSPMP